MMSLKKKTKERIKEYILEKIEMQDSSMAKKTADNFAISLTTVYRYINELCTEKCIRKKDGTYVLNETRDVKTYYTTDKLEEDRIFDDVLGDIINKLPNNVYKIWQYAFTEMMNNAIDHSNATEINVFVAHNCLTTKVTIDDNGIGIFEKIKEHYHYARLEDAVSELFKGKLTTDSENHTGEGIFFTSRMIENFGVLSGKKIFNHNPHFDITQDICSIPELKRWEYNKGTIVVMIMPNKSRTKIREVFDMYSDVENGLIKTEIPLKNIFTDGFPVSRSQAKRLSSRFDDFIEVSLDFNEIDDIGQGFAHELFVIFKKRHPKVSLKTINANEDVLKMIRHVEASNGSVIDRDTEK